MPEDVREVRRRHRRPDRVALTVPDRIALAVPNRVAVALAHKVPVCIADGLAHDLADREAKHKSLAQPHAQPVGRTHVVADAVPDRFAHHVADREAQRESVAQAHVAPKQVADAVFRLQRALRLLGAAETACGNAVLPDKKRHRDELLQRLFGDAEPERVAERSPVGPTDAGSVRVADASPERVAERVADTIAERAPNGKPVVVPI